MLSDTDLQAVIHAEFVPVQWIYDGLAGKVIRWTKEHGNTNDDPAHLLFIVDGTGKEIARARGEAESPGTMTKWLEEGRAAFEKARIRGIAHRFEPAGEGIDPLVAGERPRVVLFVPGAEAAGVAEGKAALAKAEALAKGALASKRLEEPIRPFDLIRVEVAPGADGAAPSVPWTSLPRIVVLGAEVAGGAAKRVSLEGSGVTLDALLAALKTCAPTTPAAK